MRIAPKNRLSLIAALPVLLASMFAVFPARAQRPASRGKTVEDPIEQGFEVKYRCVQIESNDVVSGCNGPLLTLHADGSYQIARELGTYEFVGGQWLLLTQSRLRGLVTYREIVFEYRDGDRSFRVTFHRVLASPSSLRNG